MSSKFGIGDLATGGLSSVGVGPLNVGNVLDTVDFVRKAWSSFGVPSNFAPTVDVEEIDRRISDLKAVEQWLNVNMNMLQGTIQALEIQRGTIATLKAYAGAFGAPPAVPGTDALANLLAAVGASAGAAPTDSTRGSASAESATHASAATVPARHDDPAAGETAQREEAATRAEVGQEEAAGRTQPPRKSRRTAAAAETASAQPGLDPAAWWNLLQSQFNNIASAAISGAGLPSALTGRSQSESRSGRPEKASPKLARTSDRGAPVASGKSKSRSARPAKHAHDGDGTKTNGASTATRRRRTDKPG